MSVLSRRVFFVEVTLPLVRFQGSVDPRFASQQKRSMACGRTKPIVALMLTADNPKQDFLDLLSHIVNWWKYHVGRRRSLKLESLLSKEIDSIVRLTPETNLIHEFNHSRTSFSQGDSLRKLGVRDDYSVIDQEYLQMIYHYLVQYRVM
ncbi:hypothetical protein BDV39DRAFT_208736 [Aspergillus sergii]|uniref:Uncharacterized protein n=1 Tax=Aspergillus sergii TaxID=1034303 RepID=A0A5N6WSH8_9EURO|nr:hypothetical protein BDV39DRAFT_208736 [Aspergillus sergii]